MKLEFKETLDSITDEIKETAENVQEKTSDFHENYVSKVLPDCGKYGDAAKFAAEIVPGVAEYNALVDGDWTSFAISAGIDIAALGVGAFTMGAGYAAVQGSKLGAKASGELIEAGAKKIVKEATEKVAKETAENVTEKVVKEIAEEGVEKAVKETVENTAEKAAKEVAEEGIEKAAKETGEKVTKEVVEEGTEKTSLKVGEAIDKAKLSESFKEVEKITGREISANQKELLQKAIKETDYKKLDSSEVKTARQYFNNHRLSLIKQWEENTGKEWPRFTEDILDSNGEILRKAGRYIDGHHFIELSTGGQNEWWNLQPVYIDEHNAIHAAGSITSEIFR